MSEYTDYAEKGLKIALTTGASLICDNIVPGSGCVVDVLEAVYHFGNGDNISGVCSLLGGAINLATFGLFKAVKNAGSGLVKGAAISEARALGNGATRQVKKQIGDKLGNRLAQNLVGESLEEGAKRAVSKQANKLLAGQLFINGVCSNGLNQLLSGSIEIGAERLVQEGGEYLLKKKACECIFSHATTKAAEEVFSSAARAEVWLRLATNVTQTAIERRRKNDDGN